MEKVDRRVSTVLLCGALAVTASQIPPFRDLMAEVFQKVGKALSQTWDDILAAGERARPMPDPNECLKSPIAAAGACRAAAIACCADLEDDGEMTSSDRGRCNRVKNTQPPYSQQCATLCGDMAEVCR